MYNIGYDCYYDVYTMLCSNTKGKQEVRHLTLLNV